MSDSAPALVTLHLWGVAPVALPRAISRMALDRKPLRRIPGLRFAKLLGTGRGSTFLIRDADPLHWALLSSWDSCDAAASFQNGATCARWNALARERLVVSMRPLSSRGRWGRTDPFGSPEPRAYDGPVAALTRARIVARKSLAFWQSVPPVAAQVHHSPGLRFALGIADLPLVLQGTFSLWESSEALNKFAYGAGAHSAAASRTADVGWFGESLFARFELLSVSGCFDGRAITGSFAASTPSTSQEPG